MASISTLCEARLAISPLHFAASHKVLIEANDQLGKGYRFLEGSVPAYLWITVARKRFLKNQRPSASEPAGESAAESAAAARA